MQIQHHDTWLLLDDDLISDTEMKHSPGCFESDPSSRFTTILAGFVSLFLLNSYIELSPERTVLPQDDLFLDPLFPRELWKQLDRKG